MQYQNCGALTWLNLDKANKSFNSSSVKSSCGCCGLEFVVEGRRVGSLRVFEGLGLGAGGSAIWGKAKGSLFASESNPLHKSSLHRQAIILAPGVSEMSLGLQVLFTVRGSSTDPNKIVGLKHSLMVAISVADFCQEYHRQASPGSQYFL